jgi:hypothetical protein
VISVYKRTFGAITPGSTDGGYMAYVVNAVPAPAAQARISTVPEWAIAIYMLRSANEPRAEHQKPRDVVTHR